MLYSLCVLYLHNPYLINNRLVEVPLQEFVALSANNNCMQSEIRNVLTTIHIFSSSSEWLKDNVSMNFYIDTIPSSYVWSTLRMTISSVKISYPAECNCHLLYRMTSESYLTFLFHCCDCIQANVNSIHHVSFQDHHPLVQHVLLCTTGSSTYEINY